MQLSKRNLLNILDFLDKCKDFGIKDYNIDLDCLGDNDVNFCIEVRGNYGIICYNNVFDCLVEEFLYELEKDFNVRESYCVPQDLDFDKDCVLCFSLSEK